MSCAVLTSSFPSSASSSSIILRTTRPQISGLVPLLGRKFDPPSLSSSLFHTLFPPLQRTSYRSVLANLKQGGEDEKLVTGKDPSQLKQSTQYPDFPNAAVDDPQTASSWVIKLEHSVNSFLISLVINLLETLYRDRPYARFYVLETIARVPYFAFTCVLHLYETCGWWRSPDYLKVHFAESWNELHHLLIMEELGGGEALFDRLLARNVAVVYYFLTVFMYVVSPRMAYHLAECVEKHAYASYDGFLNLRGEELKRMPAPQVAVRYYTGGGEGDGRDLYMFDEFQTSRAPGSRRPKVENLYDVFVNVRDDEAEHCDTMRACQWAPRGTLLSPHSRKQEPSEVAVGDPGSVPSLSSQVSSEESLADAVQQSCMSLPDRNN